MGKEEEYLFDPDLLPAGPQEALGDEFQIRPLARSDYARGHLDTLKVLTVVKDVGESAWQARFDEMKALQGSYYYIVIVKKDEDRIMANGAIFLERKFIRACGTVAHIEDIAVLKGAQGKSLGRRVMETLIGISEKLGAYKTALDCNEANTVFYEKCGFVKKECQMVRYAEDASNKS